MWRLTERIVRSALVTAWRLAISPTSTSPPLLNATTDGVVRPPSAFAMMVGSPPSRTATALFVVPRSMPTARAMVLVSLRGSEVECLGLKVDRSDAVGQTGRSKLAFTSLNFGGGRGVPARRPLPSSGAGGPARTGRGPSPPDASAIGAIVRGWSTSARRTSSTPGSPTGASSPSASTRASGSPTPAAGAAFVADAVRTASASLPRSAPRGHHRPGPRRLPGRHPPRPRRHLGHGRRRGARPAGQRGGAPAPRHLGPRPRSPRSSWASTPRTSRVSGRSGRPCSPAARRPWSTTASSTRRARCRRCGSRGPRSTTCPASGGTPTCGSRRRPPRPGSRRRVAAGGTVVDDSEAPSFTVLADPDGNKVCVCTFLDRG